MSLYQTLRTLFASKPPPPCRGCLALMRDLQQTRNQLSDSMQRTEVLERHVHLATAQLMQRKAKAS